jgi:FdhD protein
MSRRSPDRSHALPVWSPAAAAVVERAVVRLGAAAPVGRAPDRDDLVAEEPLEIRIGGESLMVTMRTPGDDLDLAAGLLFTEGVITSFDETIVLAPGGDTAGRDRDNVIDVKAADGRRLEVGTARRVLRATAACGLCGKESIAAVRRRLRPLAGDDGVRVPLGVLLGMPAALRAAQPVFSATGGLHAASLFAPDGTLRCVREDVGRHNAVDKVIGAELRSGGVRLSSSVMFLSGRAGFELVQKAAVAGIPVLCSVSAPSGLAVDLAAEVGMTLVGFVRGAAANVYTHPRRVV